MEKVFLFLNALPLPHHYIFKSFMIFYFFLINNKKICNIPYTRTNKKKKKRDVKNGRKQLFRISVFKKKVTILGI